MPVISLQNLRTTCKPGDATVHAPRMCEDPMLPLLAGAKAVSCAQRELREHLRHERVFTLQRQN